MTKVKSFNKNLKLKQNANTVICSNRNKHHQFKVFIEIIENFWFYVSIKIAYGSSIQVCNDFSNSLENAFITQLYNKGHITQNGKFKYTNKVKGHNIRT